MSFKSAAMWAVMVLSVSCAACRARGVSFAWDASTGPNVAGYNVYRSTTPGVFRGAPLNGGTLVKTTRYTDRSVADGVTYYYVVRAVNTSGVESPNSNMIRAVK